MRHILGRAALDLGQEPATDERVVPAVHGDQLIAVASHAANGLPEPDGRDRTIHLEAHDAWADAGLQHGGEDRVLCAFDVELQQVDRGVTQLGHQRIEAVDRTLEPLVRVLQVDGRVGDVRRIPRPIEAQGGVLGPQANRHEAEPWLSRCDRLRERDRPRGGIKGDDLAAEALDEAEIEGHVLSDTGAVAPPGRADQPGRHDPSPVRAADLLETELGMALDARRDRAAYPAERPGLAGAQEPHVPGSGFARADWMRPSANRRQTRMRFRRRYRFGDARITNVVQ